MEKRWEHLDEKGWKKAKAISKAAARLFNNRGYLESSMDDISAAAKMSKGGVYHYFSSKDEILFFTLSHYLDVILQGLQEALDEIEKGDSKIKFIISRHIALYVQNPSEAKTLLHEARCLPKKYFEVIAEKEREYYQIVSKVLLGFFEGQIPKERLTVITFLLFGMCNWIYSWYHPKGTVTPEELSSIIYDLFTEGVKKYQ